MSKSERAFWIGEKQRTKWAETGPEMAVKRVLENIQQRVGFTFKHGTEAFPLSIVCGEYTMHPDFIVTMPVFDHSCQTIPPTLMRRNGQIDKVIEVDGIYHFTDWQRKKGRWRDSLILAQGYDVIHVDARLCQKTYLPHLQAELTRALTKGSPVEFIDG